MRAIKYVIFIVVFTHCSKNDNGISNIPSDPDQVQSCSNVEWPSWQGSQYVLPYPVGKSYVTGLTACSASFHAPGQPDQFAIDFDMSIGEEITASFSGTVVFVEESGGDFGFPNNKVVVQTGNIFVQYMHLTQNGAEVNVGDAIQTGDLIGYSGATGTAGYPHLHFVVTQGESFEYPYESVPVTFRNTTANPNSLISGETYEALPY